MALLAYNSKPKPETTTNKLLPARHFRPEAELEQQLQEQEEEGRQREWQGWHNNNWVQRFLWGQGRHHRAQLLHNLKSVEERAADGASNQELAGYGFDTYWLQRF